MTKPRQISIRVTDGLGKSLEKKAFKDGRSLTNLVAKILADWLEENK